jgi:hypothetical protein
VDIQEHDKLGPLEPGIEVREVRIGSDRVVDVFYNISLRADGCNDHWSGPRIGETA